jgi:hypothetical protein
VTYIPTQIGDITVRVYVNRIAVLVAFVLAACNDSQSVPPTALYVARAAQAGTSGATVVDVGNDTTAQNETPIAVNPINTQNFIVGANDWNHNDGCAVNASFDGGKSWTPTVPNGFLPGVTRYTNDPNVAGTGTGDFGGDPAVAFGTDGIAYYLCYTYRVSGYSSYKAQLLLSTSKDGGKTWRAGGTKEPLTVVAQWDASGITKGSTGQFQDHESIWVDPTDGTIYVTWAQFHGNGSNSPIYVAVSADGGDTFSTPAQITASTVRSNQDARIVTGDGRAYLTFDNGVQGGKGTVMYVSESVDKGVTWSPPVQFATFINPVCLFPPYCFNVSGTPFRGPGSYPVPAFDPTSKRLYVAYSDIVDGRAQLFLSFAPYNGVTDASQWSRIPMAPGASGDRLNVEMSIDRKSGRIDFIADDRSYSNNTLVDITYGKSTDGGATFVTQRVTRQGFDPAQSGVPSGNASGFRPFIGDYNGIVSLPTKAAFAWTGVGKPLGSPPIDLDIFFGSVTP